MATEIIHVDFWEALKGIFTATWYFGGLFLKLAWKFLLVLLAIAILGKWISNKFRGGE